MSKNNPEHPEVFLLRSATNHYRSRTVLFSIIFVIEVSVFISALWAGWHFGGTGGLLGVASIGGIVFVMIGGFTAIGTISEAEGWLSSRHDLAVMRNEYAWKEHENQQKDLRRLMEENNIDPKGFRE